MCTTGLALAGCSSSASAMALGCRNPTNNVVLPHPVKLGSLVFLFLLPPQLQPITSFKHKLPLLPPMCGHGDLEIVSVKELADGFLHFSFGIPSNVSTPSKVDELSSSCGEHLAGKSAAPPRLPSKFSKKSPIPIAAVRQRKRQGENLTRQETTKVSPPLLKEAVQLSLRPKSSFVKRSPIPKAKSFLNETSSNEVIIKDKRGPMLQRGKSGAIEEAQTPKRPQSKFIRKSPVPSTTNHYAKDPVSQAVPEHSFHKVDDTAVKIPGKLRISRPKSVFVRRSPIVRAEQCSSGKDSHKIHDVSGCVTREANKKSEFVMESPSSRPPPIVDLGKCKLAELKSLAKLKGIKGYSKLKKAELLSLLKSLPVD